MTAGDRHVVYGAFQTGPLQFECRIRTLDPATLTLDAGVLIANEFTQGSNCDGRIIADDTTPGVVWHWALYSLYASRIDLTTGIVEQFTLPVAATLYPAGLDVAGGNAYVTLLPPFGSPERRLEVPTGCCAPTSPASTPPPSRSLVPRKSPASSASSTANSSSPSAPKSSRPSTRPPSPRHPSIPRSSRRYRVSCSSPEMASGGPPTRATTPAVSSSTNTTRRRTASSPPARRRLGSTPPSTRTAPV